MARSPATISVRNRKESLVPESPMPEAPVAPVPDIDHDAPWVRRFRAARVSLPSHAHHAPDRCVLMSNVSGTFEVYAWDRATGALRRATDRPNGTSYGGIDPS